MKLNEYKSGDQLIVQIQGRLDASWSEYFQEALLEFVRNGEHDILLDAEGLRFLSSMGIRSLMILHKELDAVHGGFKLLNSAGMVKETLIHSGLGQWLSDEQLPSDPSNSKNLTASSPEGRVFETHELNPNASLQLEDIDAWEAWTPIKEERAKSVLFTPETYALGIGGNGTTFDEAKDYFGEFLAAGGHIAIQPPDERGRPDCMLHEQEFLPSLHCIQGLIMKGNFRHLLRFRSPDKSELFPLSNLIKKLQETCECDDIGFVIVGEIEGLVGASLIRSPGHIKEGQDIKHPEIKNWLSFCGERSFARDQVLVVGAVSKGTSPSNAYPIDLGHQNHTHLHASVFPYQVLPNGQIEVNDISQRFFNGSAPKAVMHLINDSRPGMGLGESALLNGAAWCAPLEKKEETL